MINRIGIVGAGAIGCSLGSALLETYGERFCFVASGNRAERLRANGLIINGVSVFPPIYDQPDDKGLDLLFLAVKNYSLEDTLDTIEPLITGKTIILPLLNGVTAVGEVRKRFPYNIVPYGIVLRTDAERVGKEITVSIHGEVQIGFAKDEDPHTVLMQEIHDILVNAGIDCKIYPDMRHMQWRKWMVNIGANQASALTCAKFKYFGQFDEIIVLVRESVQEILEISKKKNVGMTEKDVDDIIELLINYPPEKKTSMFQDIEAKRRTEIDYFAGTVIKMGQETGVPTPVNRVMYYALKAREQVGLAEKAEEERE